MNGVGCEHCCRVHVGPPCWCESHDDENDTMREFRELPAYTLSGIFTFIDGDGKRRVMP